jgi:thiamine biosynthesis lipoprotein
MSGDSDHMPVQRFAHDAMACTFELYIVGADRTYARQAAQAALAEVDRLEQVLSRFVPHSDVARLNALSAGDSIRVGIETIECLQLAEQLYRETRGAFDIAFRSRARSRRPTRTRAALPLVFDPSQHSVGVRRVAVKLDLGGLAKGYAVDRAVAVLREWGVSAALVHAGQSTVYALGDLPEGGGWRVDLRSPDDPTETLGRLPLCDAALSGSGQRLHGPHIVDPRTGQPAGARAAWAIAPTGALADGLSTAFVVMSPEEAESLCGRWRGVSAILLPTGRGPQKLMCFGPCGGLLKRGNRAAGQVVHRSDLPSP